MDEEDIDNQQDMGDESPDRNDDDDQEEPDGDDDGVGKSLYFF